jgi:hypothetical protein
MADVPRRQQRRGRHDSGEQHQREAEPVEPEVITDVERADPHVRLRELRPSECGIEAGERDGGENERGKAEGERHDAARAGAGLTENRE